MRTPESDSGDFDEAFGTGRGAGPDGEPDAVTPDDPAPAEDETLHVQQDEALDLQQDELSAFEFETDTYAATATDDHADAHVEGDLNGDGIVDEADVHEAATSPFEFENTDFLHSGVLGFGRSAWSSHDEQ